MSVITAGPGKESPTLPETTESAPPNDPIQTGEGRARPKSVKPSLEIHDNAPSPVANTGTPSKLPSTPYEAAMPGESTPAESRRMISKRLLPLDSCDRKYTS